MEDNRNIKIIEAGFSSKRFFYCMSQKYGEDIAKNMTLGDIIDKETEISLIRTVNLGRKTLNEIRDKLYDLGLSLRYK